MLKDWFKYIEKRLKLLHYRDANDFEQKMKKLYIIWLGYTLVYNEKTGKYRMLEEEYPNRWSGTMIHLTKDCNTCMSEDIRWYKGKYKVKIVLKSKGNWMVEALEEVIIRGDPNMLGYPKIISKGERFVTVPRLLWKTQRRA